LRMPGQYYDAETGLTQNYFRDYDSATGRYVESDPVGLAGGGYSTYEYGFSNPLMSTDPTGEAPPGRTAPGISIPLPVPPVVVPGTPENDAWVQSAYQQIGDAINSLVSMCKAKTCPPCTPYAEGTIGYLGPHTDHDHFNKKLGRYLNPHLNLFEVNQNKADCHCRWNKSKLDSAEPPPLPGWVDLNNGFPALSP
jgi:RHS repeat-associated protein